MTEGYGAGRGSGKIPSNSDNFAGLISKGLKENVSVESVRKADIPGMEDWNSVTAAYLILIPDLEMQRLRPHFYTTEEGGVMWEVTEDTLENPEELCNEILAPFPPQCEALTKRLIDVVIDDSDRIKNDWVKTATLAIENDPYVQRKVDRESKVEKMLQDVWGE
jgi:hypothetical protein